MLAIRSIAHADEEIPIPMLALLYMAEFGFLVTGAGTFFGARILLSKGFDLKLAVLTLGCAVLAIVLAVMGLGLWVLVGAA